MKRTILFFAILVMALSDAFAQKPDADGVYSQGHGVNAPRLVKSAAVIYPTDAASPAVTRDCTIAVVIGTDGKPAREQILQSAGAEFDAAAIEAVHQSQFEAGSYRGKHVPVTIVLWIPFWSDRSPASPEMLERLQDQDKPVLVLAVGGENAATPKKAKYQGVVFVSALISEDGAASNLHVVQPLGMGLDVRAVDAVRHYSFKPAIKNGKPVPLQTTIEVYFKLY